MSRGAFIVFEGPDRAGKSTQISMLIEALKKRLIPVKQIDFPDRSTAIGGLINDYLTKKIELSPEAALLLFSANRWECKDNLLKTLEEGITIVASRYAGSGAAYGSVSTNRTLDWCKAPDQGLPKPDIVIYLEVEFTKSLLKRAEFGLERYECEDVQTRVSNTFPGLFESTWLSIRAEDKKTRIHNDILGNILKAIEQVKSRPIGMLYDKKNQ